MDISEKTRRALCAKAEYCAADMSAKDARNKGIMSETALDRLENQEACDEIEKLITVHGYAEVQKAVEKFIPTY